MNTPSSEGVHTEPAKTVQWVGPSQEQMRQLRQQLLESILAWVVQAVKGLFIPGGGFGSALEQLEDWANGLLDAVGLGEMTGLDFSSPTAFISSLIVAIGEAIGIDLHELGAVFTTLDLSSPLAFILSLGDALIQFGNFLTHLSPLNALNLFNIVPTQLLGQLNFSNIGETLTNLITDPLFQISEAFAGLLDWNHDPGAGHVGTGAAMTTANGTTHELLGNLIPASVGQVMNFSGWVKWSGLTGTGNPIALAVTGYDINGTAISQANIATHSTTPATTDWLNLNGTYTVPAGVTGVRTRLSVGSGATAGTVWWDDMSATKTQTMFQRLIAGTNSGENLTNDVEHLFTGIVTNAVSLLTKASQGDFSDLLSTIGGPFGDDLAAAEQRLEDFLHSLSPLNGSRIASGSIADNFIPGIGNLHDNIVTAVGNLTGSGFDLAKMFEVLTGQTHALVDHGAGISDMFARMSNLESQFAALPISAGGTGSGNADGGAVGALDTDTFERASSSNLGALWLQSYSGGAGTWATPNGHDASWIASGSSTREFLCIRNNSAVPRSQTDYQRVTMELSSKATRDRDLLGLYDFCGTNDIWLRISDATTSLANVTGYRIRWEGDGALYIHRFTNGTGVQLGPGLGTGGITPPGPGAQLIGEAGVLADGARFFIRAKIGESIRLSFNDTGSGISGAANRRWGHGGRAQGASLFVGQTKPGGVHFWNGMDQTLT